jgi:hypothetical protein
MNRMLMQLFILPSAFCFGFTGCGKRITNANIDAVNSAFDRVEKSGRSETGEKGVTPKEVESILGTPTRVENFKMEVQTHKPIVEGVRYIYEQDGDKVTLHFVDNRLISKAPHFGETETAGAEEMKSEKPQQEPQPSQSQP